MKKRIIALLSILLLLSSFTIGCSKETESGTKDKKKTEKTTIVGTWISDVPVGEMLYKTMFYDQEFKTTEFDFSDVVAEMIIKVDDVGNVEISVDDAWVVDFTDAYYDGINYYLEEILSGEVSLENYFKENGTTPEAFRTSISTILKTAVSELQGTYTYTYEDDVLTLTDSDGKKEVLGVVLSAESLTVNTWENGPLSEFVSPLLPITLYKY